MNKVHITQLITQTLLDYLIRGELADSQKRHIKRIYHHAPKAFLSLLSRINAEPYAYDYLHSAGLLSDFPQKEQQRWQQKRQACLAHNSFLLKQAKEISQNLSQSNIPHCFIKGVAQLFSGTFDPVQGLCRTGDIDVYVPEAYGEAAVCCLSDFKPINPDYTWTTRDPRAHSVTLRHKSLRLYVDMHIKVGQKSIQQSFTGDQLLDSRRYVSFQGVQMPIAGDALRYLHSFRHAAQYLSNSHSVDFSFQSLLELALTQQQVLKIQGIAQATHWEWAWTQLMMQYDVRVPSLAGLSTLERLLGNALYAFIKHSPCTPRNALAAGIKSAFNALIILQTADVRWRKLTPKKAMRHINEIFITSRGAP